MLVALSIAMAALMLGEFHRDFDKVYDACVNEQEDSDGED